MHIATIRKNFLIALLTEAQPYNKIFGLFNFHLKCYCCGCFCCRFFFACPFNSFWNKYCYKIAAANVLLCQHFIFMTSQRSWKKLSFFSCMRTILNWNKNSITARHHPKKVTINFVENWIPLTVTPQLHHSNTVCTGLFNLVCSNNY